MAARLFQCHCGQVVSIADEAALAKARCPSCGAGMTSGGRRAARQATSLAPELQEPHEDSAGDYRIAGTEATPAVPLAERSTFAPSHGVRRTGPALARTPLKVAVESDPATDPPTEPFFCLGALLYPWIGSNWVRWLGLTMVVYLATLCVGVSLFVGRIVVRFGAFLSVFAVGGMVMACLALVAFIAAAFVRVIEESAAGSNRIDRLPDMGWDETLGPFFRTLSPLLIAAGVSVAFSLPFRRWMPLDDSRMLVIQAAFGYPVFPVLLVATLVAQSVFPFGELAATLARLSRCLGEFVGMLAVTGCVAVGLGFGLLAILGSNWVLAAAAAPPILAAWTMFYGHWIGRLCRAMTAVD